MAMGRWEKTHEHLQQVACELFVQHGYDAVTTAHIAQQAGVTEMTLFRHFPAKESLLLADPFDPVMAELVRSRPAEEPPMQAVAEGIRQAWQHVDNDSEQVLRERLQVIAQTPTLAGAIERNSAETVSALAEALTDRGSTGLQAKAVAAAVIAGLSAALLEWARASDDQPESPPLSAALDSALTAMTGC